MHFLKHGCSCIIKPLAGAAALFLIISSINSCAYSDRLVMRVIDGDTVQLANGDRLRYIGIDTPEFGHRNREIRKVMEHLGLEVNRLIRVAFGPFQLGKLTRGQTAEITGKALKEQLSGSGGGAPRPKAKKTGWAKKSPKRRKKKTGVSRKKAHEAVGHGN